MVLLNNVKPLNKRTSLNTNARSFPNFPKIVERLFFVYDWSIISSCIPIARPNKTRDAAVEIVTSEEPPTD